MFSKPLNEVKEEDLQALVDNQVREDKYLDYKETLDIKQPSGRKEFCADVSSFANTDGGYLIYGMKKDPTDAGLSSEVCGLLLDDPGKTETRLGSILETGLDPQLSTSGVHVHPIQLSSNGKWAIIIQIQKSLRFPHMVKDYGKFYLRSATASHPMDTAEVRSAFEFSGAMTDRIHSFRTERLSRIMACDELPALLDENAPKLVLHMIPLSAFNPLATVDFWGVLRDALNWQLMRTLISWDDKLDSGRFNLDGIAWVYPPPSVNSISRRAYTQVFRKGVIESVVDLSFFVPEALQNHKFEEGLKVFSGKQCELALLRGIRRYAELQKKLGIEPPVFIMVSFLGVKDCKMPTEPYRGNIFTGDAMDKAILEEANIDRTNLIIPEALMDTFDGENDDIAKVMKPAFDTLWNARGYASSPYYDDSGKYRTSF